MVNILRGYRRSVVENVIWLAFEVLGHVEALLFLVSKTLWSLLEVNVAPNCAEEWYDAIKEKGARLANATVHHGLDCQGQDKDDGVARGAHKAKRGVHGDLAAVEPGDRARSVLEAEEEDEDGYEG